MKTIVLLKYLWACSPPNRCVIFSIGQKFWFFPSILFNEKYLRFTSRKGKNLEAKDFPRLGRFISKILRIEVRICDAVEKAKRRHEIDSRQEGMDSVSLILPCRRTNSSTPPHVQMKKRCKHGIFEKEFSMSESNDNRYRKKKNHGTKEHAEKLSRLSFNTFLGISSFETHCHDVQNNLCRNVVLDIVNVCLHYDKNLRWIFPRH